MTITKLKTKPFSLLESFWNDPAFGLNTREFSSVPAVNIIESDDSFNLEVVAPGFKKDEIDVEIDKNQIIIEGKKEEEKDTEEKNYKRREFAAMSFTRSFIIPEHAEHDKISAGYEDGILKVTIPKIKSAISKSRKLKIS